MRPAHLLTPILLLLCACGGKIQALYEAEKAHALAAPPPVAADWKPDLRLLVGEPPLERAALAAMDDGLDQVDDKLQLEVLGGRAALRPKLSAKTADLRVLPDCSGCVEARVDLEGRLHWSLGPFDGDLPMTVSVGGKLRFVLSERAPWVLNGRLDSLDRVAVQVARVREVDVGPLVSGMVKKALGLAPALTLGGFGGEDLPIRAMRLGGGPGALELQALSDAPHPVPVDPGDGLPGGSRNPSDWALRVHPATLVSIARREAFKLGPQDFDVAGDPRALRVSPGAFEMDLRLWRLSGAGWWRDYTVKGQLLVDSSELRLKTTDAQATGSSPGAGLVDPLAFLAQGLIVNGLAGAIDEALPSGTRAEAGRLLFDAGVTGNQADGETLVVLGRFELRRQPTK